ncbi:PAS domain S-box protein [Sesbania bispinosa]|nr:PAS domain S-box protein [Sesbania bispinosa]
MKSKGAAKPASSKDTEPLKKKAKTSTSSLPPKQLRPTNNPPIPKGNDPKEGSRTLNEPPPKTPNSKKKETREETQLSPRLESMPSLEKTSMGSFKHCS